MKLESSALPAYVRDARQLYPLFRFLSDSLGHALFFSRNCFEVGFSDMHIRVADTQTFDFLHGSSFRRSESGLSGFVSYNNPSSPRIVVREGTIQEVAGTLGHEIGHALLDEVGTRECEEAKAYAYEFGVANLIRENNFGGLGNSVVAEARLSPDSIRWPAHARAHRYVTQLIDQEAEPFRLAYDFSVGNIWIP